MNNLHRHLPGPRGGAGVGADGDRPLRVAAGGVPAGWLGLHCGNRSLGGARAAAGRIRVARGGQRRRDTQWPRYDPDNGQMAGLPAKLRRLWEKCPWAHDRKARRPGGNTPRGRLS